MSIHNNINNNNNTSTTVPSRQRALVLQGGGALGAYDAGVFQALYDKIGMEFSETRPLTMCCKFGEMRTV